MYGIGDVVLSKSRRAATKEEDEKQRKETRDMCGKHIERGNRGDPRNEIERELEGKGHDKVRD